MDKQGKNDEHFPGNEQNPGLEYAKASLTGVDFIHAGRGAGKRGLTTASFDHEVLGEELVNFH